MAKYRLNIKSLEIPDWKLQVFMKGWSDLFASLARHGCAAEVDGELLIPYEKDEEEQWVKDFRDSPEGVEYVEEIEKHEKEVKDLICPDCGFVGKHQGALKGHIRFKHKR